MALAESLQELRQMWEAIGRTGEHWPRGPRGPALASVIPVSAYLELAAPVELAAETVGGAVRSLRRTRASVHVRLPDMRRLGRRLDELLAGNPADEPLAWSDAVPAAAVDELATVGFVSAAGAQPPIELGRLLAGVDAALTGASNLGLTGARLTATSASGLATWLGDLAAWFVEWDRRRAAAERTGDSWDPAVGLDEAQRAMAPVEALLGAIDGQILGAYYGATVFYEYDDPDDAGGLEPGIHIQRARPLREAATLYYLGPATPEPSVEEPRVKHRFALFARHASPAIAGPELASLDDTVAGYVRRAAALFIYHGSRRRWVETDPTPTVERAVERVEEQAEAAAEIGRRFATFVRTGIETGEPPPAWPRAT
jgi:hypothetical protein